MAISTLTEETASKIHFQKDPAVEPYTFRIDALGRYITITNNETGEEIVRSIEALGRMRDSTGFSAPVRDMARAALDFAGKEDKTEADLSSTTIVIIDGVKVYQDMRTRRFFAKVGGTPVFRTRLSELEKVIKKGVV